MSIRIEDSGHCLIVHNRTEKRGAITPELYDSILAAIKQAHAPRIRALILTGGAFFCAGGDLQTLRTRAALPRNDRRQRIERLHDVIRAMHASPVPLIAAVEGGAAGAGLSLALACDFIIAAKASSFTAAYVKAGLTPDGGLTHALSRLLPRQMAIDACLLGKPVTAERLDALGIVTELCDKGEALDGAHRLAATLARGPQQAQSRIRKLLSVAPENDLATQLDLEADFMAEAQGSPEAAEGIAAFLEKRRPEFGK